MKALILNYYHKLTYKLFGWHRDKVILCRDIALVFDVNKMYEDIKARNLNEEIEQLQREFDKKDQERQAIYDEIKAFQRTIDNETYDLMLELIKLKNKLNPEQKANFEKLREHYEKVKSGNPNIDKAPKRNTNVDKRLKKLYLKMVKIYHPDKAPKGKEEEYTEIFRTITLYKDNNDFAGLKAYARTLTRFAKKQKINLSKLKEIKEDLIKKIKQLEEDYYEFLDLPIHTDYELYKRNPTGYIRQKRDEMRLAIKNLQDEIYLRENGFRQHSRASSIRRFF